MSPSSPLAVSMTMGISFVSAWLLRRLATSSPSIPGSMRSSRMRSGATSAALSRASSPVATQVTENPSPDRLKRSNSRRSSSSSTTRILELGMSRILKKTQCQLIDNTRMLVSCEFSVRIWLGRLRDSGLPLLHPFSSLSDTSPATNL